MSPPSVAAIAAPTGPPRLGLRPISTLTRLTAPNAANASIASANSSRAMRLPGCGATKAKASSTASRGSRVGGEGGSMDVFSLRAMGSHLPHVRNHQWPLAQLVAEVAANRAYDFFFH